ncbi:MAG: penicillin-binding protein 2 [Actinobacteria bacterium]|nr:penicillin-binding protein 2 [Actinomycetota bacterium]
MVKRNKRKLTFSRGKKRPERKKAQVEETPAPLSGGIDPTKIRLAFLGIAIVLAFGGIFSRLWFLQVLAADDYRLLAKNNRVRTIRSEPPRGRILDRNRKVLVGSRFSLSVTIDRQVLTPGQRQRKVLDRLSRVLDVKSSDLRAELLDRAVSPYKPVPVANDVSEKDIAYIREHQQDFPGVKYDELPIRTYPQGKAAAHILGYVNEISESQLDDLYFENARPVYRPGDTVGQAGIELTYDKHLRGRPEIRRVIVNAANEVTSSHVIQREHPGEDLVLSLDLEVQQLTEKALADGIEAARVGGFNAPAGAAVVLDPRTGRLVAMASLPDYDPSILADGITQKEYDRLGNDTPENPDDDALLNRGLQAQRPPGSTFKVVTAGAAMQSGVATPYTVLPCPGSFRYREVTFNNWTLSDLGAMAFPESLEQSCDTFYYQLGADMEETFGEREPFQKYAKRIGFGDETGIDLPNEEEGIVPTRKWCDAISKETDGAICGEGWLPGFTVNMSTGQGSMIVTPLQMANTYAALANGGNIWEPQVAMRKTKPDPETGKTDVLREFEPQKASRLPLDPTEMSVIKSGLVDVISGDDGTARSAFEGFPLGRVPLAGKTGTAELSSSDTSLNDAWFVSYGPDADAPEYVISVYVEEAGHGGESAAPIARQIWEGITGVDRKTDEVSLATDSSG